jgi:hypothetical protein
VRLPGVAIPLAVIIAGAAAGGWAVTATHTPSVATQSPPHTINTLQMAPGSNLDITCPNTLTNRNVTAHTETVRCAKTTTTTSVP